jgi:hypothetical protein
VADILRDVRHASRQTLELVPVTNAAGRDRQLQERNKAMDIQCLNQGY